MVQAGGDQNPLQKAVEEQPRIPCRGDPPGEAVHRLLDGRPHKAGGQPQPGRHRRHAQERPADAPVNAQRRGAELFLASPVVDPAGQKAQQDAAGDAHVHRLDAQHHGLSRAVQAQGWVGGGQAAQLLQGGVPRRQKDQVGQQGDHTGLMLVPPGRESRDAHAEHHAQILDDGHHPVVGHMAQQGQRRPLQGGHHRAQPRRRRQRSGGQHQARRRQIAQRRQHGGGKPFQRAQHPLFWLHGRPLLSCPFDIV